MDNNIISDKCVKYNYRSAVQNKFICTECGKCGCLLAFEMPANTDRNNIIIECDDCGGETVLN